MAGTESVIPTANQLGGGGGGGPHTHPFVSATGKPTANSATGTVADPTGAVPAVLSVNAYNTASSGTVMGTATCTATTAPTGQAGPIDILSTLPGDELHYCSGRYFPHPATDPATQLLTTLFLKHIIYGRSYWLCNRFCRQFCSQGLGHVPGRDNGHFSKYGAVLHLRNNLWRQWTNYFFALPDLRGRAVVGAGQGAGLSSYDLGQLAGTEISTATNAQLPPQHITYCYLKNYTRCKYLGRWSNTRKWCICFANKRRTALWAGGGSVAMKTYPGTLTTGINTGGPTPFPTLHPVLALNCLVCIQNVFPARN